MRHQTIEVFEECDVSQLIDFVRAYRLKAQVVFESRERGFTAAHEGDAGPGKSDLRGGAELNDVVLCARRNSIIAYAAQFGSASGQGVNSVGIVVKNQKITLCKAR